MRMGRWLALLMLLGCAATPARAQIGDPPVHQDIDVNGVDLINKVATTSMTDVSIGPSDGRGLAYSRTWLSGGWFDNFSVLLRGSTSNPIVTIGASSQNFHLSGSTYVADAGNGATLVLSSGHYIYTSPSGTVITFTVSSDYSFYGYLFSYIGYVTSIAMPDGTAWTYHYRTISIASESESDYDSDPSAYYSYVTGRRVQSVTNNLGYQLKFAYADNSTGAIWSNYEEGWIQRSAVTAINNAVEYCDPNADSCSLTNSWPTASFAYDVDNHIVSYTDPRGGVWAYTYGGPYNRSLATVRRPGSSVDDLSVTYSGWTPATVTRHGNTWTYGFGVTGFRTGLTTTTVQDPTAGPARTRYVSYDPATSLVKSDVDENGSETKYDYDGSGRLTSFTPPMGNTTLYEYDGGASGGRGNVTKVTYQQSSGPGATTIDTYATYPSSCSGTDMLSGETVAAANCNKPTSSTDARGKITYYYWNPNGPIGWIKAPAMPNGVHPETHYSYVNVGAWYYGAAGGSSLGNSADQVNILVDVRACRTGSWPCAASDQSVTSLGYYGGPGATNVLLESTTATGGSSGSPVSTTGLAYDAIGDVTGITDPLGNVTTRTYDANRAVTEARGPDPDGAGPLRSRSARTIYNADGSANIVMVGTSNADGSGFTGLQYVTPLYDDYGRKWLETLSNGSSDFAQTQYNYDAVGRVECTAQRMNPALFGSATQTVTACTQRSAGSFGPDRITHTIYEYAGLVDRVQTGYATALQRDEVHYVHDGNGQVTSLTDANGNVTTYDYDTFERPTATHYPNASGGGSSLSDVEYLTLDGSGNVTVRQLRDGTSVGYAYDDLGRVTSKTRPSGESAVGYTYDNQGRVLTAAQTGLTLTQTYDALGRLTSAAQPFGTLGYGYDAAGRRTSVTLPGGLAATYCYDATGAMTQVREGGAGCSGGTLLASYGYDALGNRTSIARGNGVTTTLSYDSVSRLTQIAHDLAGSADDQTIGLTGYNPAGQITGRSSSNDVYAWTQHYDVSRGYAADGLNRYTSISSGGWAGTITPGYDARGNLTGAGPVTYAYTSENLLKSSSDGVTLYYDPADRLSEYDTTTTTRFAYDGGEIASEVDYAGTILRRYVTGAGADEPLVWYEGAGTSDKRWLIADERGSIIAVTNASGQQLAINSYDDYGIPASTNLGRFQYTGQAWLPELGLYYYKARMYSATLGRFLQTDPIGYGDGPNWYNYTHSDPVNNVDPSGTGSCPPGGSGEIVVCGGVQIPDGCGIGGGLPPDYCSNNPPPFGTPTPTSPDPGATPQPAPQNDIVVTAKKLVANHPYVAAGIAVTAVTLACPECDVAEIVVTGVRAASRLSFFRRALNWITGNACFAAGTLVQTDHGLRPIETIRPGDMVLSRDEKTGRTAYKRVTAVKVPTQDDLYTVELDVPAEKTAEHHAEFKATATHPWRTTDGQWVATAQLHGGMTLVRADGAPAKVEWVRDTHRMAPTYNLTVEGYHTYFVGRDHVWVHNACNFGGTKSAQKWANQMANRGWTEAQIEEAIANGESFPATNNINPGNGATRYVNPTTGRSVVVDNTTGDVIHVGGDGFVY